MTGERDAERGRGSCLPERAPVRRLRVHRYDDRGGLLGWRAARVCA